MECIYPDLFHCRKFAVQSDCRIHAAQVVANHAKFSLVVRFDSKRDVQCVKDAAITASRGLGYEGMKSEQIVDSFVTGHDVFGVLPTGDGKSPCYACLPFVFDHLLQKSSGFSIVLVVSPLVALVKDQVRQISEHDFDFEYKTDMQVASYSAKGLRAAQVTGDSSKSIKKEVQDGEYQLVYITPELLITGSV